MAPPDVMVAVRHSIEQVQVGVVGSSLLLQRRRRRLVLRLGTKREATGRCSRVQKGAHGSEVSEVVDVVVRGRRSGRRWQCRSVQRKVKQRRGRGSR
jgi:hypothetical protein